MLAIAGGKGGSGKTTTALGVARAVRDSGGQPLVVDCDCDMPDLHHQAGVDSLGGVDDVADGAAVERAAVESDRIQGVRILTAGRRDRVDATLARLPTWPGAVILDCPPGIGPDAARPLRHADRTLLVSSNRRQSVNDTRTTARSARKLGAPPAGLLVRETGVGQSATWPEIRSVRSRVPTVPDPFDHPTVRDAWESVARALFDGSRSATAAAVRKPSHPTERS